jgi:hypothetical protein
MNTSFLKKVFGVYRFYKDYRKFLSISMFICRNFPKLIFEGQQEEDRNYERGSEAVPQH